MISFKIPEKVTNELQLVKMVAEQVMRSKSRYYDEHEHERPWEYINMMWQFLKGQNKRQYERITNGQQHERKGPGTAIVRLACVVE
ncbi:MAG: hypothetical protein WBG61_14875, partial [Desulfobacterales bacterium]